MSTAIFLVRPQSLKSPSKVTQAFFPVVQQLIHHHYIRSTVWNTTRPIRNAMEVNDRTPPLVVSSIAIVGIIWVVMVLGIRLYLRYKLNGPIGNDDYAAILATSLGIAQSAVVLAGVNSGLGHRATIEEEGSHDQTTAKIGYAATLLYLSATYVSRASSCLLYIRLTSTRSHLMAAFTGLGMSAVGGMICLLAIAFQCSLPTPWSVPDGQHCIDMWRLWKGVELTAVALEVFIFGISLLLVWSLRMKLRLKAMVVFAFSVRLLVIIPIGLRLEYINHAAISSRSIYTSVAVTAITTITTHIAIMSSTLPCLKQFLAMFESGMIGEFSDATYTGSGKGTRTDTSIALASLTSGIGTVRGRRRRASDELELRPDQIVGDSRAEISADAISAISNRSDAAIIKKTQRWEISYD